MNIVPFMYVTDLHDVFFSVNNSFVWSVWEVGILTNQQPDLQLPEIDSLDSGDLLS